MYFFTLVKTSPHHPFSPSNSQTYLSTPSLSKRGIVLSVKESQSVLFENATVRTSLKSVRWKESLATTGGVAVEAVPCCFNGAVSVMSCQSE